MAALPLTPWTSHAGEYFPRFYIFSKHLQFLNYQDMADAAAECGFDGIDLTVRPKGHVLPERAHEDLPRAVEAIKKAGLRPDLMASGINNAEDEVNRKVLEVASAQGIKLYRLSYLKFSKERSIPDEIHAFNSQLKRLAAFNRDLGIIGAYQNHSGTGMGAAIWDIYLSLADIEPEQIGCQYDIRHAVVEGGMSWTNGLKLIRPKINSLVLKDFIWKKVDGKWKLTNVPLGMGMVDFPRYFKMVKAMNIDVPITVHYEYDLEGVEHGATSLDSSKYKLVFDAFKRDLKKAREMWEMA